MDRVKGAQQMLNHAQGGGGGSQKRVGTSKLKTAGAAVMAAAGTGAKKEAVVARAPAAIKPQRSRVRSSSLPGREAVIQTLPTIPSVPAIAVDLC